MIGMRGGSLLALKAADANLFSTAATGLAEVAAIATPFVAANVIGGFVNTFAGDGNNSRRSSTPGMGGPGV